MDEDDLTFELECCTTEMELGCNKCSYNNGEPDCSRRLMLDVLKRLKNNRKPEET